MSDAQDSMDLDELVDVHRAAIQAIKELREAVSKQQQELRANDSDLFHAEQRAAGLERMLAESERKRTRYIPALNSLTDLAWQHRAFLAEMGWTGHLSHLESVALICEEIGELAQELRRHAIDKEAVSDELADIMLRTMALCLELEIDPGRAVFAKIDKNCRNIDAIKAKGRKV